MHLPNDWGFFDMMGNVWEGVWDVAQVGDASDVTDPAGDPASPIRDMRGGAYGAGGFYTRSAMRVHQTRETRNHSVGFRVVCGPAAPGSGTFPGDPAGTARRLVDLGRREVEEGRAEEAANDFARAAALSPDDPQLFLDSGWWVIGPYPEDLARVFPPEAGADPSRPVDGVAPDAGGPTPRLPWRSAPTHAQGGVDFVGVFDPPEHITGYALAEVWSSKDREAVFSIGSDDRSRIWLDGQLIHEFDPPEDTATPPDTFRAVVRLRAGRNRVLAKVTNGANPHRLYLRILTDPGGIARRQGRRPGAGGPVVGGGVGPDRGRPARPGPRPRTTPARGHGPADGRRPRGVSPPLRRDPGPRRRIHPAGGAQQPGVDVRLGPGADDPSAAVRLAETSLAKSATPAAASAALNTLGAALYRAGRLDDASARLTEGIARRGGREEPEDRAFLAMISRRKGDRPEALRRLEQLAGAGEPSPHDLWGDRQVELLRNEAEALIRPVLPDLPADVFGRPGARPDRPG